MTVLLVALLGLSVGTALCALALSGRHWWRVPAAALVGSSTVTWLLFDKQVEGPTLLVLARGHGITLADLVTLPALALLALLAAQDYRRR